MSDEREEEQIDYDLSFNINEIELDLMYQGEVSDDDSKEVASSNRDSGSIRLEKHASSTISKPYFQPRQVWTRGRARGGRETHSSGGRNQNQLERPDPRRDRLDWSSKSLPISSNPRDENYSPRNQEQRLRTVENIFENKELGSTANSKIETYKKSDGGIPCLDKRLLGNEERPKSRDLQVRSVEASKTQDRITRSDERASRTRVKIQSHQSLRSKSGDRRSSPRDKKSISEDQIEKIKDKRSRSRDNAPKNRSRRSRSRDRRSKSRGRRSKSRGRRSRSRGVDGRNIEKNKDRRSLSRGHRSRSRGRRSNSRGRSSRNQDLIRRSRSRDRRSRSRERIFSRDRRSRSRSIKRSRRHSNSSSRHSRTRSRSRDRRRRHRSYSRSKSSSPDVIVYKSKLETIDLDQYDSNRKIQDLREQRTNYSSSLLPTSVYPSHQSSGAQFRQSPPAFHHTHFQVPLPPGLEPYSQPPPTHVFPTNQPPPAPFISTQTPPAPFISDQTPSGPSQIMGAPPPQSQQFTGPPPPPILSQQSLSANQFPNLSSGQTEEFGRYQQNLSEEFIGSGFAGFERASSSDHFQSSLSQQSFNPCLPKQDFGVRPNWKPSKPLSSSILIYAPTGPETTAPPSSRTLATIKSTQNKSGVEEERQNQKQTLVLQRDQYLQKNSSLQKELSLLKEQRSELLLEDSPETERLLKENTKLQNEITQRLKAIENVIEMLTGLIKKDLPEDKDNKYLEPSPNDYHKSSLTFHHAENIKKSYLDENIMRRDGTEEKDLIKSSPKKDKTPPMREHISSLSGRRNVEKDEAVLALETSPPPLIFPKFIRERSPPKSKLPPIKESEPKVETVKAIEMPSVEAPLTLPPVSPSNLVNTVYYDPELHWCSLCKIFPKTAVDYLNHLHTPSHKQQMTILKLDSTPWHADEPSELSPPVIKNAPTKRIPIRGVQFLVPSTGWYCRLCKTWIGDLHCAQEHLKGRQHTTNYSEYITQNPHWEVDWLSDRTKSFERSSDYLSRLREKNETLEPDLNKDLESEKAKFSALSESLLAVLAQQNKRQRQSSSSSSSTSSSGSEKKKQKKSKKKKAKKKKKKDESPGKMTKIKNPDKSPYVSHYRQKSINEEDFIQKPDLIGSNWMEPEKSELPISIKIKNKLKQSLDKFSDSRLQNEINKEPLSLKGERFREDRCRDERMTSKNWGTRRDQCNRRDPREIRDFRSKDQRDDTHNKMIEVQKKNLPTQRVEEHPKLERKKSPPKVFQRPDDPLDRDSPELIIYQDKRDKFTKNDKPQGKLWFPSKENKDIDEEVTVPLEKQSEDNNTKKKTEIKKTTQFSIPKTKLPFIGRMPILKKKTFDFKADESSKDSKSEKPLIWPNIPDAKEDVEVEPRKPSRNTDSPMYKSKKALTKENLHVERVLLSSIASDSKIKTNEDNLAEQDMDIANDDQDDVIWLEEGQKSELHQDFQDALDLLFPEGESQNGRQSENIDKEVTNLSKRIVFGPGLDGQFDNKLYVNEVPHQGFSGDSGFNPNGPPVRPVETSLPMGSVIPPMGNEGSLLLGLGVPPPAVSVAPPIRTERPMLMRPGGPPPLVPRGLPPVVPRGPPPVVPRGPPPVMPRGPLIGPAGPAPMGLGSSSLGNDGPLMCRPPPITSGGPPFQSSMIGANSVSSGLHGSLPMGPRGLSSITPGQMGPPTNHPDGQVIGGSPVDLMGSSLYSPEDEYDEEPAPKRKNAPSQRMRRRLQKKRAEAQAKIDITSVPPPIEERRSKYEGMDRSDLAMLGIDEDDSIIT